jgi:hypothetical protein
VRLTEHNRAALAEFANDRSVGCPDSSLVDWRSVFGGESFSLDHVLDAEWNASQRPAAGRRLRLNLDPGVDRCVGGPDPFEQRFAMRVRGFLAMRSATVKTFRDAAAPPKRTRVRIRCGDRERISAWQANGDASQEECPSVDHGGILFASQPLDRIDCNRRQRRPH